MSFHWPYQLLGQGWRSWHSRFHLDLPETRWEVFSPGLFWKTTSLTSSTNNKVHQTNTLIKDWLVFISPLVFCWSKTMTDNSISTSQMLTEKHRNTKEVIAKITLKWLKNTINSFSLQKPNVVILWFVKVSTIVVVNLINYWKELKAIHWLHFCMNF